MKIEIKKILVLMSTLLLFACGDDAEDAEEISHKRTQEKLRKIIESNKASIEKTNFEKKFIGTWTRPSDEDEKILDIAIITREGGKMFVNLGMQPEGKEVDMYRKELATFDDETLRIEGSYFFYNLTDDGKLYREGRVNDTWEKVK